jgi:hypothetical protein
VTVHAWCVTVCLCVRLTVCACAGSAWALHDAAEAGDGARITALLASADDDDYDPVRALRGGGC